MMKNERRKKGKKIDPITGHSEEISDEEFWEAINNGDGKIQRVERIVTDASSGEEISRGPSAADGEMIFCWGFWAAACRLRQNWMRPMRAMPTAWWRLRMLI